MNDYRIIADIQDDKVIILVLAVAHRREVYD
ncbi:type II toxin-antitoxin system RelE/ParE family toxin [Selenomonas flueggei]